MNLCFLKNVRFGPKQNLYAKESGLYANCTDACQRLTHRVTEFAIAYFLGKFLNVHFVIAEFGVGFLLGGFSGTASQRSWFQYCHPNT